MRHPNRDSEAFLQNGMFQRKRDSAKEKREENIP
jgi:hypothetical protein